MPIPTQMTAGTSELNPPTSTDIPDYTDNPVYATCDENTTCPHQEYCFKGQCESCKDCESWYGRQPPSPVDGISCAKSAAECGFCLPGFQENHFTRGGQMITCSPIPTSLTSYDIGPSYQIAVNVFFFFWLLMLSIKKLKKLCRCIYEKFTCCKNSNDGINNPNSEKSQPTEHSDSVPKGVELPLKQRKKPI